MRSSSWYLLSICLPLLVSSGCKFQSSRATTNESSAAESGRNYMPLRDYQSSDGSRTVTFIGMVHLAPKQFYSDIAAKLTDKVQKAKKAVVFTEGVNCFGQWLDVQALANAYPLKLKDLQATFSDGDLQAAANGDPSQAVVDFVVKYTRSWLSGIDAKGLVVYDKGCADKINSVGGSNAVFQKQTPDLAKETGRTWYYQDDSDSAYSTFLSTPGLYRRNADINSTSIDVTDASQLLWYFWTQYSLYQSLKFPGSSDDDTKAWNIILNTAPSLAVTVRDPVLLDVLDHTDPSFDLVMIPWGAAHGSDIEERLLSRGYQKKEAATVFWDDCSQAKAGGLEEQQCKAGSRYRVSQQ